MWLVYLLKCQKGFFYTGITNNLNRRIKKHNLGKGAKFTQKVKPCYEIWHEHHLSRSNAQKREKEIKNWRREKKLALTKTVKYPCSKCRK